AASGGRHRLGRAGRERRSPGLPGGPLHGGLTASRHDHCRPGHRVGHWFRWVVLNGVVLVAELSWERNLAASKKAISAVSRGGGRALARAPFLYAREFEPHVILRGPAGRADACARGHPRARATHIRPPN